MIKNKILDIKIIFNNNIRRIVFKNCFSVFENGYNSFSYFQLPFSVHVSHYHMHLFHILKNYYLKSKSSFTHSFSRSVGGRKLTYCAGKKHASQYI